MIENYARMVNEWETLLRQLNPHDQAGRYCPEAADVVHDFLDSGDATPIAQPGTLTFPMMVGGLASTSASTLGHGLHNGEHHVIRGSRQSFEDTHWFVVMKYQNTIYVVDAMTHTCTTNVSGYLAQMGLTTFRRVTGGYDVTPQDMMDMNTDIF
jgi:hypothetical protein